MVNSPKFNPKSKIILIFILITILGFFAYRKALDNFFYSDDLYYIDEAQTIHIFKLSQLRQNLYTIIKPWGSNVVFIYFFINNLLESILGANPFLYHLHNILLHILNTILVFFILYKFINSFEISSLSIFFFLLNPLHTEAIYWRAGDHTLYVTLFILLTLFCYIYSFYKSSLLFLFLAMGTKPSASVLLLYIILLEIYFFGTKMDLKLIKRLRYHILVTVFFSIIYIIFYTNLIKYKEIIGPTFAYKFNLPADSLGRFFKNLSYLLLPFRNLCYLAIPVLFSLFYLNLSKKDKRMLLFSVGFIFLSIFPYQLFKNPPHTFYSYPYNDMRYFYIPAIGQSFLVACILKIFLSRLPALKRLMVYLCIGSLLFLNLRRIGNFDMFFEGREYNNKILVKCVTPYFKNNPDKIFILFNFPSLADSVLIPPFENSVFRCISKIFFDYRLISVSELKLFINSVWIKERYPILPSMDDTVMLKFKDGIIQQIPSGDKEVYYRYFVDEASSLYSKK